MGFNSVLFIFFFLPIFMLLYIIAKDKYKNYIIIMFSILFYLWSGLYNFKILLILIIFNYLLSMFQKRNLKKSLLILSVFGNIFILAYFKYFEYLIMNINQYLNLNISLNNILAPVGISFIIFHAISYQIDTFKDLSLRETSFLDYVLYILYFPKIVQGPIIQFKDFYSSMRNRTINTIFFVEGIEKFIIGLSKKVLLADVLGSTVQLAIQNWQNSGIDQLTGWLITICYFFQIYCDFSGYSDMALGISKMLGFSFDENFNFPYLSTSITDFWRRWHISLGKWFREYVYIPLGGNRSGNVYIHLSIVFILTGIWHGTGIIYLIWGGMHGLIMLFERYLISKNIFEKIPTLFRKLYTICFVAIGWLMFLFPHYNIFIDFFRLLFGETSYSYIPFSLIYFLNIKVLFILFVCAFFSFKLYPNKLYDKVLEFNKNSIMFNAFKYCFLIIMFFLCLTNIIRGTYSPFIYTQF